MIDDDVLRDRVSELRAWALSRLHWCATEIDQYGLAGGHDAVIERRALGAVLLILDGRSSEHGHQPHRDTRYGHEVLIGCTCGWRVDPEAPDPDVDFTAHVALARVQEGELPKPKGAC